MKRWLLLLLTLLPCLALAADNLNVAFTECSSALLTLGPFVTQDGVTPVLPNTLSVQVNGATSPPTDPPLLAKTTITPPTCSTCSTPTKVTATCDAPSGVCQLLLPPWRMSKRNQYQQDMLCTIQWGWPLGQGMQQVIWTLNRSPYSPPPC